MAVLAPYRENSFPIVAKETVRLFVRVQKENSFGSECERKCLKKGQPPKIGRVTDVKDISDPPMPTIFL